MSSSAVRSRRMLGADPRYVRRASLGSTLFGIGRGLWGTVVFPFNELGVVGRFGQPFEVGAERRPAIAPRFFAHQEIGFANVGEERGPVVQRFQVLAPSLAQVTTTCRGQLFAAWKLG